MVQLRRERPEFLATQYYIPADSSSEDIQEAGKKAMADYETLNARPDHGPLQPAGVYVGSNWIPAGEAATHQG
jgi:hypothetical protein